MPSVTDKFSSIDRKGRLKLPAQGLPTRPAEQRVKDFEPALMMKPEWAVAEASRCIHCYDPACQEACPARNQISDALWLIEQGNFLEAAQLYRKTNSLPEICGRVCPQDRLCEGACVLARRGSPVHTGALETFVTEYERANRKVIIPKGASTGRKVAVIGAGPSGMACAEQLARFGHWVTVYDAHPAPGGALTYGFPNFKLPHRLITDIWHSLKQAGVSFVGNTYIGKRLTVNNLFADGFEGVFLGIGSGIDAPLDIPGESLPGVYKATDFLVRANTDLNLLAPRQRQRPEIGSRVVIIGGGDPATDCARTAVRLGANQVSVLYKYTEREIPGRVRDRQLAVEEGVNFLYLTQPVRLIPGAEKHLAQIEVAQVVIGEPDEDLLHHPALSETTTFIEADTAVVAVGYYPDPIIAATTPGLKTHEWGLLISDPETGATSRFGVFTGGDAVTGPDMVVTAMVAGRRAAYTIDAYLS